jgi:release factor glutamine methyltransferase
MIRETMQVGEALADLTHYFEERGIETPRLDAEYLLAFVLNSKRLELCLNRERELTVEQMQHLQKCRLRRGQREPLQYIMGSVEFFGHVLQVDRRVLIPRPETEELVYQLRQCYRDKPPQWMVDAGTGSGAIAIALAATFSEMHVLAVDRSMDALQLAQNNAAANGVADRIRWRCSDWLDAVEKPVDLIVSNPPYLSEDELGTAQPEVRLFEPKTALVAAEDGLADLKRLLKDARLHLQPGGLLVCETGCGQHAALRAYAQQCGYKRLKSTLDLSGKERYFWAWDPGD